MAVSTRQLRGSANGDNNFDRSVKQVNIGNNTSKNKNIDNLSKNSNGSNNFNYYGYIT